MEGNKQAGLIGLWLGCRDGVDSGKRSGVTQVLGRSLEWSRLEVQRKWECKTERRTSNIIARMWDRLPQGGSSGDSAWGRDG